MRNSTELVLFHVYWEHVCFCFCFCSDSSLIWGSHRNIEKTCEDFLAYNHKIRLHSSRMRTARVLTVSPSMLCARGWGCLLLGGVCSWGGRVCLLLGGGVSALGGVCSWGLSALGGCLFLGGVCSEGCVSQHALRQTLPVNRMTDTCKNITLPQLRCGRYWLYTYSLQEQPHIKKLLFHHKNNLLSKKHYDFITRATSYQKKIIISLQEQPPIKKIIISLQEQPPIKELLFHYKSNLLSKNYYFITRATSYQKIIISLQEQPPIKKIIISLQEQPPIKKLLFHYKSNLLSKKLLFHYNNNLLSKKLLFHYKSNLLSKKFIISLQEQPPIKKKLLFHYKNNLLSKKNFLFHYKNNLVSKKLLWGHPRKEK